MGISRQRPYLTRSQVRGFALGLIGISLVSGLSAAVVFLSGPIRLAWGPLTFSASRASRPFLISLFALVSSGFIWFQYKSRSKISDRSVWGGLILVGGLWFLFYGGLGIYLHWTWRSNTLDMALHSQLLWNLSRGNFMVTSFFNHSFVVNHFWPGIYLFLPVYLLGGNEGMILLQAAAGALSVFPAYFLARQITGSRRWGFSLAVSLLIHPTLGAGALFDYHVEIIIIPLILMALLFVHSRRFGLASVFIVVSISFYELSAVVFALLGLGMITKKAWRGPGILLFFSCLGYLAFLVGVIMPFFQPSGYWSQADRFAKLGGTPLSALKNFIRSPWVYLEGNATVLRLNTLVRLLGTYAFLPLLGAEFLLIVLPLLLIYYLSAFSLQFDIRYGYLAVTIPFFFLAAARGAARLDSFFDRGKRLVRNLGPFLLLAVAAYFSWEVQVNDPIRVHEFKARFNQDALNQAALLIPRDASLSVGPHLGPRLANRDVLLLFPRCRHQGRPVEFIFLNLADPGSLISLKKSFSFLFEEGSWGVLFFEQGVLLLKQGYDDQLLLERLNVYLGKQGSRL